MNGRTFSRTDRAEPQPQSELPWLDSPQDSRLRALTAQSRLVAALLLVLLLFLRSFDISPIEILRLRSFDTLIGLTPTAPAPSPVIAIDVDDQSLARLGQWPLPRRHYVDLVSRLREAGAAMIVFDILFTEPDRMSPEHLAKTVPGLSPELRQRLAGLGSYDDALANVMQDIPTVAALASAPNNRQSVSTPQQRRSRIAVRGAPGILDIPDIGAVIANVPQIAAASAGEGLVNLLPEPDGAARRVPALFRTGDILEPGLALETLRVALGHPNLLVEVPSPFGLAGVSIGGLFVPTDSIGRIWIDSSTRGRITTLSASDVLSNEFSPGQVAGRIAVIGTSASGVEDRVRMGNGSKISALQIQSMAIDSLISGRAPARAATMTPLETGTTALVGLLLIWLLPRFSILSKGLTAAGLTASFGGVSATCFAATGILVDATFPAMTSLVLCGLFVLADFRAEIFRRRQNEVTLKSHDTYIREVVDASFDAIVTIDESGRIRSANRAAGQLFDSEPVQLVGTAISEHLTGSWASDVAAAPADILRSTAARSDTIEADIGTASQMPRTTEITLAESASGADRVFVLVLRDISARRVAEALAARTAQRLQDAINTISDGFALFSPDQTLVLCNTHFRRVVGDHGEAVKEGMLYSEMLMLYVASRGVPPEAEISMAAWIEERLASFGTEDQSFELATMDGHWFRVDEHRTAEGGMVCLYSDITTLKHRAIELKEAKEMAEAASLAKSEFLANMSHELRTPLNAIIGFADMMRAQHFGPLGSNKYAEYAADISESGSRLLKMIEQILDFARLEKMQSRVMDTECDLAEIAHQAETDLTPMSRERSVPMRLDLAPELPHLRADPQMLYQIVQNLLTNAIKFSPAGAEITVSGRLSEDGRIVIAIADKGIGIPAALIRNVTQPFWQRPDAMTSSHEGVGLGLAIVNSHVEAHGAELSVESTPGRGTTFTVTFPEWRTMGAEA